MDFRNRLELIFKDYNCKKAVDLATGRGDMLAFLQSIFKNCDKYIGIDNTPRACEVAGERFKDDEKIEIIEMDAAKLDFEDESIDVISIANSLHHLESPENGINEAHRVLKDNGYFILSEMYKDGNQTKAQLNHVDVHHWWAKIDRRLGIYHNETYKREELIDFIEKAGFKDIEIYIMNSAEGDMDPHDTDTVARIKKIIDQYILKIENESCQELKDEGAKIIRNIDKHGFLFCCGIFLIAKK